MVGRKRVFHGIYLASQCLLGRSVKAHGFIIERTVT